MGRLAALTDRLGEQVATLAGKAQVPGALVGVSHQGEQALVTHGIANVATGAAMTRDTAWLLGSVTKLLTTTLVLRLVERGLLDLDEQVVAYLPDFVLADAEATQDLRLRHLLNHTSGIDADTLMPTHDEGPAAVNTYVQALAQRGTLFAPGELIHYSNPGFCVAGRIAEVVTGTPFNQLLESEVYAPSGMQRSCTSVEQAILGRVATGSFPDPTGGRPRQTTLFRLPSSVAPAGSTPIVTLDDILAFARMQLADGVAADGTRVLSREHAQAMRTVSKDMGTPNVPPIGLGWWVVPIGATTALWHGGGSPGGISSLVVVPEHDLVVASYGNGAGAGGIHDAVLATVLDELAGVAVALPPASGGAPSMARYDGVYSGFQVRTCVAHDGDGLTVTPEMVPCDAAHQRLAVAYLGSTPITTPVRFDAVREGLFGPAGAAPAAVAGLSGRTAMVSFHQSDAEGRPRYLHHGLRIARRETSPDDRRQGE